jgi:hypothetical protein
MRVTDVFGVRKAYELNNYVVREGIDDAFISALEVGKHVSVFGASKTGKSSLIEKNVGSAERLCVQCAFDWTYDDFIDAILHAAFGRVETESTTEKETQSDVDGGVKIQSQISQLQIALGKSFKRRSTRIVRTKDNHTYNLENSGDFVRLFSDLGYGQGAERDKTLYLVIDDFHRLPDGIQEKIASLAKMLFDSSNVVLIVVGIWVEENKLSSLCAELMGRCVDINCNLWSNDNLLEVVNNGCQMLNVEFPQGLPESIVRYSYGNVFVVQESCKETCNVANIRESQENTTVIEKTINALEIVNIVTSRECNFTDMHNKLLRIEGSDIKVLFPYAIMLDKVGNQAIDMDSLAALISTKFDKYKFDSHFAENSCRRFSELIRERNLGKVFDFSRDSRSGRYKIELVDKTLRFWLKGRRNQFIQEIRDRIDKQMDDAPLSDVKPAPNSK